jgi:hypothetical protein
MTKGAFSLFLFLLSSYPANIQSILVLAGTTETILNQAGKQLTKNQTGNTSLPVSKVYPIFGSKLLNPMVSPFSLLKISMTPGRKSSYMRWQKKSRFLEHCDHYLT